MTESQGTAQDQSQSQDQGQNGNGDNGNGKDQQQIASDAGKLLAAEVTLNQARVNAMATGLQQHQDALDDAQSAYDEQRDAVDDDALRYAYSTLLDPVGTGDMSRQIDTTGLGGFGASSGVVHAANVFGSPVQKAVAAMATQTPADPVTVVGAVPRSDLVDPDSLEQAKTGGRGGKKKRSGGNGGSSSGGNGGGQSSSSAGQSNGGSGSTGQ